jgi:hypothetical protein
MGAEFVLAVDISSAPENAKTGDMFQILMQTFTIMGKSINNFELREADVVVRPALGTVGSAEFSARRKSIEAGRRCHACKPCQKYVPRLCLVKKEGPSCDGPCKGSDHPKVFTRSEETIF